MRKALLKVALLALLVFAVQGTWALAGTTGTLTGYVRLQDGSPVAGAKVTATSPSEVISATTDAGGHFSFVSLTPDTYSVSAAKDGYDTVSQSGITVIADNQQTVTLHTQRQAAVLAVIPVRAANELVRPGTTADVYSVNAAQAAKFSTLGGGGGTDTTYGAIAALPGVFVGGQQMGWMQTVHIRGGDFNQNGYEYDGVPVNRSFDNYAASTLSNVGQGEVQVYTGAAPQNAEGQGLSGFINQVIKTGTYPGFSNLDLAVGGPGLYNKINLEVGGSTPSRNFTYYVATGGYSVRPRIYDNNDGAVWDSQFGQPFDFYAGTQFGGGFAGQAPSPYCTTVHTPDSCDSNYAILGSFLAGKNVPLGIGPGGYILGPFAYQSSTVPVGSYNDRENVVNLHFGLPHRSDSGKDDIQLLYSNSYMTNPQQAGESAWGVPTFALDATQGLGFYGIQTPTAPLKGANWFGGLQMTTPIATPYASGCPAPCGVIPYDYPGSNVLGAYGGVPGLPVNSLLPSGFTDELSQNGQGIFKLQYQHNIGSNAYLRVYGYSYYSWWYLYGPESTNNAFVGCCPPDYELITHTRGASAQFADQLNDKNLFTAQIAGVTARTTRDNNTQMLNVLSGARSLAFDLVDANNPYAGLCYGTGGGSVASCEPGGAGGLSFAGVFAGGVPAAPATGCGPAFADPCAYLQVESGPYATYNNVKPTFYSGSLGDQWKPSEKLLLNLGLRLDSFQFQGGQTDFGNISTFWYNAFNNEFCISALPGSSPVSKINDLATYFTPLAAGPITPQTPCTSINDPTNPGHTYLGANLIDASAQKFTYTELQPRLGGTFTASPDDVIRFSVGKYSAPPVTAVEQYNTLQYNSAQFLGSRFLQYGLNTPGHELGPESSWNSDLSWEHRFANSDVSFKLSPFMRKTSNQYQQFFLDQKTLFVSQLPIGKQTSEGVELQLQKGDFSRNGLSGLLSYTYTWTYVQYGTLPGNGGTPFTPINNAIKTYNAYTSFCASNPTDPRCGTTTNLTTATPCYTTSGVPDAGCAMGSIANPYWNAPVQDLFDPNGRYLPFTILPNGFNSSVNSFSVPNAGTLVLNWKHDKLAITPALQYFGEGFYGAPLQNPGVDPATNLIPGNGFSGSLTDGGCTGGLAASSSDPRYPYGFPAVGTGGVPYDATTCQSNILIPDPYTGKFDNLGTFRSPQQLLGSLQISYEATPRITYVASVNNLLDTCWGGSKQPWTVVAGNKACWYYVPGAGVVPSTGNFYNPDSTPQTFVRYPYEPQFVSGGALAPGGAIAPLEAYFEIKVKL